MKAHGLAAPFSLHRDTTLAPRDRPNHRPELKSDAPGGQCPTDRLDEVAVASGRAERRRVHGGRATQLLEDLSRADPGDVCRIESFNHPADELTDRRRHR